MRVVLQYFDGCPNWVEADAWLRQALAVLGAGGASVEHQRIETMEEAVSARFMGSPSILVDGRDPFAVEGAQPGLACRVYPTPAGLRGAPTLEQLVAALQA
jgi:hypothetical protein